MIAGLEGQAVGVEKVNFLSRPELDVYDFHLFRYGSGLDFVFHRILLCGKSPLTTHITGAGIAIPQVCCF
jgi:hypothetical protein